jgi:phosphoribosylanthranilate isomerase
MPRTRVKICCIQNIEEARLAIKFGADAIGLVGKMPSEPGPIKDSTVKEVAASVSPAIGTFLLTSEVTATEIVNHWKKVHTNTIQIVDYIDESEYAKIRSEIPWVKLVQVIHVEDGTSINRAVRIEKYVDGILLDSGKPNAATKILGGTGMTHNWEISKEIVARTGKPVFLAGGIKPENVKVAIQHIRPFGIDVCTGVRTDGKLDRKKLEEFFEEIAD